MDSTALVALLRETLPDAALEARDAVDQPELVVPREQLLAVCRSLRDQPALGFRLLAELTAVDRWPAAEPRFEVVYHLACLGGPGADAPPPRRLRLKVRVAGDDAVVPSLVGLWPNANWYEREVYDLFGIVFDGHPDLRRLLMPEEWEGHPARKDSPVQVKVGVRTELPLMVTGEEFLRNIARQRVVPKGGPGAPAGRGGERE
jgi:NADH-quinone oxidoreductase subunit C